MTVPSLPAELVTVSVAGYSTPSTLAIGPLCSLRRQARSTSGRRLQGLLENPLSILGTLVHEAIEGADGCHELVDYFYQLVAEKDKQLQEDSRRSHFAPILQSSGAKAESRALRLLKARTGESHYVERPLASSRDNYASREGADSGFGHEVILESQALKLRGTADLVEELPDGSIKITDWKTGELVEPDGKIKDRYRLQLAAYQLLAEERWPGRHIRTFLSNGVELEVEVLDADRAMVKDLLGQLLPHGLSPSEYLASDLATPSSECGWCPIRHICPKFIEQLRRTSRFRAPGASTFTGDVLGLLRDLERHATGFIANLELADGSPCQIRGLSERFDLADLLGSRLAFFGLIPRQRRSRAGHGELPPNIYAELLPDHRAWNAEVFVVDSPHLD